MPIYLWRCKKCGGKMEKLISIGAYDRGEYTMEVDDDTTTEGLKSKCKHEFEREVESGIRVTHGGQWGGGKGYWAILCALGSSLLSLLERGYW